MKNTLQIVDIVLFPDHNFNKVYEIYSVNNKVNREETSTVLKPYYQHI